ncbi:hypothetical protein [Pseudonocardia pini]|uniref:hypothetical protein n=1 Tax=Pseudonocardia pini TaxID=2758030 RepID=UPI0015F0051B|nr:hypothetical protein [Pseudonocardia pini]
MDGVLWWTGSRPQPGCRVTAAGAWFSLTAEQAENAATVAGVGFAEGVPDHAVTVAVATAMQESRLANLPDGDRDSAGLFQQRPSQGWGTYAQVTDPVTPRRPSTGRWRSCRTGRRSRSPRPPSWSRVRPRRRPTRSGSRRRAPSPSR